MAQKRDLRPVLSKDLTDAVEQVILDAADAGIDLDDIDDNPRIRGKLRKDDAALNNLVALKSQGGPIPGQSLTNDPEQPYPWETPPEFANPREALDDILSSLLQPEAVKEIINSLVNGASVGDLAMAIVYAKFIEGKINPDVMMMLAEPVMYTIMAIGEEANIKYNIEGNDLDEFDEEDELEDFNNKINEFRNVLTDIKKGATKNIEPSKINTKVVPESILAQVKEKGPEIKSLLSKGEE